MAGYSVFTREQEENNMGTDDSSEAAPEPVVQQIQIRESYIPSEFTNQYVAQQASEDEPTPPPE